MSNKKKQLSGRGKLVAEISNMEKILQKEQQGQNSEKKIAQAILDAQKMHEESYIPGELIKDAREILAGITHYPGKYKLNFEECFQVACKVNCLSPNMWSLLCLANHWYNDIQLWEEDVLAGKNILEECQKEHAKMKNEMKRIGEIADEICSISGAEDCSKCSESQINECKGNVAVDENYEQGIADIKPEFNAKDGNCRDV